MLQSAYLSAILAVRFEKDEVFRIVNLHTGSRVPGPWKGLLNGGKKYYVMGVLLLISTTVVEIIISQNIG